MNDWSFSPVSISFTRQASTKYWLPFIRSMHGQQGDKPQVILVGTRLDEIGNVRQGMYDFVFVSDNIEQLNLKSTVNV